MREGIYRLYRQYRSGSESRMIARFMIAGDRIAILEDHDGFMKELIGDSGKLTGEILRRLQAMSLSAYWRLVNEDDLDEGVHDDLIEKLPGESEYPEPEEE